MIYLLRHGDDDETRVGGYSDVSLTDIGKSQIEQIAKYIKENLNIKRIYTSDVKRAKETSDIVNKYLNLKIIEDKNLRELDKGLLTGRRKISLTERELQNLNTKDIHEKILGGESMNDLYNRIYNLYKNDYFIDKDNSLFVTHRGVINMIYSILNKEEVTMDKEKYHVTHGSLHQMNVKKKQIVKIK